MPAGETGDKAAGDLPEIPPIRLAELLSTRLLEILPVRLPERLLIRLLEMRPRAR